MRRGPLTRGILLTTLTLPAALSFAQQAGGIRGRIVDQDFEAPLAGARVIIAETGQEVTATDQGNYVFSELEPGTYTLIFAKQGYTREVETDVVVSPGQLTEVDSGLSGDFTEMDEFIVQDLSFGGGTELGLLELRMESPALVDSISSELISKAGASDAADALTLVAGATVEDGKFAVIRGLPDRYVNSQLNSIRLPTADAEKRAVELDQFPSAAIESVQVTKTFTPDQQGDASGGAVNIILKGVPEENFIKFSTSTSYNTETSYRDDFLTYDDGGVGYFGDRGEDRDLFGFEVGSPWPGDVGVSEDNAPIDYKWSISGGIRDELDNGVNIGGLGTIYYERDSQSISDAIDDEYWVTEPGGPMVPRFSQGTPQDGDFKTSLFDVQQSSQSVKWGALGVVGLESERHKLTFTGLYTRDTEDTATLAEDTRGKEYFFPGYDPDDPDHPGNQERQAAPYIRTETLSYVERETKTLQLAGEHMLPDPGLQIDGIIESLDPVFSWSLSNSIASFYEPDKRSFSSLWVAESNNPGFPPFQPPFVEPPQYLPFRPSATFTLGNLQRSTREIEEESDQAQFNLEFPFEQWTGDEGYLKVGFFRDDTERDFRQEAFSNLGGAVPVYFGEWDEPWSEVWEDQDVPISASNIDVDYLGEQEIVASYWMADIPLTSWFNVIGGYRYEDTMLSTTVFPEERATWFPGGGGFPTQLNPGDADVDFEQRDSLPSIGFRFQPLDEITLRGTYSETVARQTFRELTPVQQQEFVGGDVFIGNPTLGMSALKNYDLRLDYTPYQGGLVSASYFYKDITDPIEYVQRVSGFTYTTPVNYPEGELSGWEFEIRQQMDALWDPLSGLQLGANATLIDSEVILPEDEQEMFSSPAVQAPIETRDMTNAPEYLYNLFMVYEMGKLGLAGTTLAVFYTVRGDTLVAGAGVDRGNFVPSVYETEFGTLNASLTQDLGAGWEVKLQAKNILDPAIETVYRSEFIGDDVVKTSYHKGIDFSVGVSATF